MVFPPKKQMGFRGGSRRYTKIFKSFDFRWCAFTILAGWVSGEAHGGTQRYSKVSISDGVLLLFLQEVFGEAYGGTQRSSKVSIFDGVILLFLQGGFPWRLTAILGTSGVILGHLGAS